MKIEHKIFDAQVKAFDDENLIVENFISTEHKDRGGDIMRAKGMKIVGKPVVLLLHGRGQMGSEPVGKPLSITVDEFKGQPGILAKTQFYDDEVGRRLYGKVKGGFLPNWSIGYSVDEAKDLLREGKYDGRDVTKWQLLEYSPVGVPMNPFAQTIKEFLDKNEDPKGPFEVPESHWFGLVDEKSCTGCGACANHGTCPTCKGPVTFFAKGEDLLGKACEKCNPEKFAELTKAIEEKAPDPMEARMQKIEASVGKCEEMCMKCEDACKRMEEAMLASAQAMTDAMKKFEPLLKTLPPEPDGGKKGDEEHTDNPPEEKKTPPRLVFKDDAREAQEKKARDAAAVIGVVQGLLRPTLDAQVDRVLGRVN